MYYHRLKMYVEAPPFILDNSPFLNKSELHYIMTLGKRPLTPEGVSPVQRWILTDYSSRIPTECTPDQKMRAMFNVGFVVPPVLSKPADPQTSSNTRDDDFEDSHAVSANVSTSSSEMRSEKTSKETDEVAAQSENIGKLLYIKEICSLVK